MPGADSLEYIREHYNVPAYRGVRVLVGLSGRPGVIVGGRGPYLRVLRDGSRTPFPYHPTDRIVYQVRGLTELRKGLDEA